MIELTSKQFPSLLPMFARTHFGVLAAGTLEGGHPGRAFVNRLENPGAALVCTKVGYYFLAGSPDTGDVIGSINNLFREDLVPHQMKTAEDPQVLLFYDPPGWKSHLLQTFAEYKPLSIHKKRLVLSEESKANYLTKNWQTQIPEGLRIVPATVELLEQYPEEARAIQVFWGSLDRFVNMSFGFWLMDGEMLASSCEAIFIGAGEAEISIATSMHYRRRGLARLTASALITACLERGLNPIWGCWPENEPSVSLATNLGFQEDFEHEICFFDCRKSS